MIVDSQVHIWAPSTPGRPWPAITKKPHREKPLSRDELLLEMDAAGVSRAILVSPSWEGIRNDLVLEAARDYPRRFGVMGRVDPEDPRSISQLDGWMSRPGMLGMRVALHTAPLQMQLAEGGLEWLWTAAEKEGIALMIYAPHACLHLVARVAERHPGLRIIMCHLSIPSLTRGHDAFGGLDRLLALARFPNVAAKASSLPGHSSEPYPYRDLEPHLRRVYDAFGPRRMFWGTDFSRLPCTYRQAITMYTEELHWLSGEDKEWIMGRAVSEWLGWPYLQLGVGPAGVTPAS